MVKRSKRLHHPNQFYFITVVTRNRFPHLQTDQQKKQVLEAYREVRRYHPFRVAGLVILNDHWHCLVQPGNGVRIGTVVGAVKKNIWNRIASGQSSIWQKRFWDHRIRGRRDFNSCLEYIQNNPVKHGYVENPEDWPWCYIHGQPFG